MRVLILGASRGTGALACRLLLERGHDVTAFARSPQNLVLEHPKLTRRVGDFHDEASVRQAVLEHDAVIITASAMGSHAFKEEPLYFSKGTGYAIAAMKSANIKRLVVLSAFGAGESRRVAGFVLKVLMKLLLEAPYADHDRQEALVRDSGLDWVIARPTRLTNGPARKRYQKKTTIEPVPNAISRADVADFLVEATTTDTWLRQCVQLGG
jgi:uncharacterized protein YbjT (DUF2867 family)